MTTHTENNKSHTVLDCLCPAVGSKLPDYIVDLLPDDDAFEVEQHLAECNHCKERYLLVLRVQSEASMRRKITIPNNGPITLSNDILESIEIGDH